MAHQLLKASRIWSERTSSPDDIIRQYILADIGRYDESEDTEYNLGAIEERLRVLVEDVHFPERFLVSALIRDIELVFQDQLEDAQKGDNSREVMRMRDVKSRLIEKATQQERQSASFQRRLKGLDAFEQSIYPTPEKVAEKRLFLKIWREVTASIVPLNDLQEEK